MITMPDMRSLLYTANTQTEPLKHKGMRVDAAHTELPNIRSIQRFRRVTGQSTKVICMPL